MTLDTFYAILSGICFTLAGLWWNVANSRKDWLKVSSLRSLAGGVYASFLIPGVMSLGAQIGGENKLVWRSVFAIAAIFGMVFTTRLLTHLRKLGQVGFFGRTRWLVILIYALVLIVGIFPELAGPLGLAPIQVEALLLCIIVLTGNGLAWEVMANSPAA
jgi:hypothetical protein